MTNYLKPFFKPLEASLLLLTFFPFALLGQSSPTSPKGLDPLFRELLVSRDTPDSIQWSFDSRHVAYVASSAANRSLPEIFTFDVATSEKHCVLPAASLIDHFGQRSKTVRDLTGKAERLDYRWDPGNRRLLVITSHRLSWLDLNTGALTSILDDERSLSDPKISPDGKAIGFIRNHTLWAIDVDGKNCRQLSATGSEDLLEGELDWAYRQAFHVKTAYWWAPDSSAIAYLETNEQGVHRYRLPQVEEDAGESETMHFPLPGKAIPVTRPLIVKLSARVAKPIEPPSTLEGYIPVLRWFPTSRGIVWEHLNRAQTQIDVVSYQLNPAKTTTVLTEEDKYWINIFDHLLWFKDGSRFIWTSERSGFRHLYLYDLSGKMLAQLTQGDWEVTSLNGIDNEKIYFTATENSPRERHLYSVNLDGSGLKRITDQPGTHEVELSPDFSSYLDAYSTASMPPVFKVCRVADASVLSTIYENSTWPKLRPYAGAVELTSVNTHLGLRLDALSIKPPDFQEGRKYPVIVHLFSGPGTQVADDRWGGASSVWQFRMAQKGFIIWAVDTRGAAGHGPLFEEPLHYRLAAQEMGDQRDVLSSLRSLPFVDPARIGVWGSGYGGFLVLHALMDRPVGYKCGLAIAPVSNWENFNALFSERYLDMPQRNGNGYEASSPLNELRGYKANLLIAQGLLDKEIHLSQSLQVQKVLLNLGASADLMLFPVAGHSFDDPSDSIALFERATEFFLKGL